MDINYSVTMNSRSNLVWLMTERKVAIYCKLKLSDLAELTFGNFYCNKCYCFIMDNTIQGQNVGKIT